MLTIEEFYDVIDYQFNNKNFLQEALTHPSLSKERKSSFNYQRLEFLGDKVLSLVITEFLVQTYKNEKEGELSRRHAVLVSGEVLSDIAKEIRVDEVLQMSSGEFNLGGKENKKNLENALEAVIAGIYLDGGYEKARDFIMKFWQYYLTRDDEPPKDPVSQLQELVQLKSKELPIYSIKKVGGSDHKPEFCAKVKIGYLDKEFESSGGSKKEAQKKVAQLALEQLL